MLARAGRARGVRRRGARRRARATWCCWAWAAPRSRPRCCAARSARPHRRPAPARARLDRRRRDPRGRAGRGRARQRTLFVVSSKSGGTIEPLSLFAHFFSLRRRRRRLRRDHRPRLGPGGARRASTASGATFAGDPDIGGRYSALSAFGIVPAALMGVDVRALLEGAAGAWRTAAQRRVRRRRAQDCGVWLGAALSALARGGRDKLTFVISETLPGLGLWLEQLVAESTGKQGTGILPVADEPLGEPGRVRRGPRVRLPARPRRARRRARRARAGARRRRASRDHDAHARAGGPRARVPAVGAGRRGRRLGPSDQPVRPAQRAAGQGRDQARARRLRSQARAARARRRRRGGAARAAARLPAPAVRRDHGLLRAHRPSSTRPPRELRAAIRAATRAHDHVRLRPALPALDRPVPQGRPAGPGASCSCSTTGPTTSRSRARPTRFTTLKNAQAIGDLQTLRELGLPAERVRLQGDDPAGALRALTADDQGAA